MTKTQYQEELEYLWIYNIQEKIKQLKDYDIDEDRKIQFIENLYKLANISYDLYIKNWQDYINK